MIEIGLKHTSELTVTDAVTAVKVGSGDMPVLATPMMMALMENAAMLAVKDELPETFHVNSMIALTSVPMERATMIPPSV